MRSTLLALAFAASFVVMPLSQAQTQPGRNPVPAGQGAPSTPTGNYILSPNDVVLVKVFQEPELDSQHRISADGTITFPLIGSVRIGGKTVDGASDTIRGMLLKGYLHHPQVRVNIVEYAKRRFTVIGQVQKPGSYVLPEEQSADLLQAVAMAGGFTRLADTGKVTIRRTVNGEEKSFKVSIKAGSAQFLVLPNDTITVGERFF